MEVGRKMFKRGVQGNIDAAMECEPIKAIYYLLQAAKAVVDATLRWLFAHSATAH